MNEKNRNNKIMCECGSSIPHGQRKRHYYTKKHVNFVRRTESHRLYLESIKLFYYEPHYDSETCENRTENNSKN